MSGLQSGTDTLFNESGATGHGTSSAGPSRAASMAPAADGEQGFVQPPTQPKRRMVITHDRYMRLQSLIVMHLAQVERETGKGMDRDELIDWYLETMEEEIQNVEELEYEKELITKMLRKLVKVCAKGCIVSSSLTPCPTRISTCLKSEATSRSPCPHPWTRAAGTRRWNRKMRTCVYTTWSTRQSTRRDRRRCLDWSLYFVWICLSPVWLVILSCCCITLSDPHLLYCVILLLWICFEQV